MKQVLTEGNIGKGLILFSLPMIAGNLLQQLYNVVDTLIVGQTIGAQALSAVGSSYALMVLLTSVILGLCMGSGVVFSQLYGANREEEVKVSIVNAFVLIFLVSAVVMALSYLLLNSIVVWMQIPKEAIVYAKEYLTIIFSGILFVFLYNFFSAILRSVGNTFIPLVFLGVSAFLNIVLDLVFILVFHMGVKGAATATVLSQMCSALWVLKFLTGKKAVLHLKKDAMRLSWSRVKSIMSLGISGFMMAFTNSIVQVFCNMTLHQYGGDLYVGVMTVLNSIREITTTPVNGLTSGASPVMSFNYGENACHRVRKAIRFVTVLCVSYTMIIWGLLKLFPEFFIRIFNSEPELISRGIPALHIYFFGYCFMALQFTAQCTFVALGKARKATFFSIFRKVLIVVPLTVLLPGVGNLGVDGVFWAEPISNLIGGCASFFTMLLTVMPELKKGAKGK